MPLLIDQKPHDGEVVRVHFQFAQHPHPEPMRYIRTPIRDRWQTTVGPPAYYQVSSGDEWWRPTCSTQAHINRVRELLDQVIADLTRRGILHDASKLVEPEATAFAASSDRLGRLTYGTPAYHDALHDLGAALTHHYAHNRHHPEYHHDGVNDMTLVDLIEMLCDWKAAAERQGNGDILASLRINEHRFGISPQLAGVLENTAVALWPKG
jgi:hypothetical protein